MASTIQDKLYEIFAAIAGEQTRFPERSTQPAPSVADEKLMAPVEGAEMQASPLSHLEPRASASDGSAQQAQSPLGEVRQRVFGDAATTLATNSLTALVSPAGGVVDAVKQVAE